MGQQESHNQQNQNQQPQGSQTSRKRYQQQMAYQSTKFSNKKNNRLQHQGLLRLRQTPFRNCIQIQDKDSNHPLFLQSAQITLSDLLETRLFTNRLFTQEDIEKMMESVIYTMAYLQQHSIFYRDICTQNIYYNQGNFKLLPNELIPMTPYQVAVKQRMKVYRPKANSKYSNQDLDQTENNNEQNTPFMILSPQMIIALRCQQPQIIDLDILHKSNVFIFGMILLQVTTLLPSEQCFDIQTYDILDNVVTHRLALVQQHYSQKIARIIGNMLDYDYSQRMDLLQLSIYLNRELNDSIKSSNVQSGIKESNINKGSSRGILTKSRMVNSRTENKGKNGVSNSNINQNESFTKNSNYNLQNNKNTASRSNLVYMNYDQNYDHSDPRQRCYQIPPNLKDQSHKNKVYLRDAQKQQRIQYEHQINNQNQGNNNNEDYSPRDVNNQQEIDSFNNNRFVKANKSRHCFERKSNKELESSEQYKNNKQKQKQNPYFDPSNHNKKNTFKYYPSFENLQEEYPNLKSDVKRVVPTIKSKANLNMNDDNNFGHHQSNDSFSKKSSASRSSRTAQNNDHSINRIKQQIQKSRRLIQQFQKNDGVPIHSKHK